MRAGVVRDADSDRRGDSEGCAVRPSSTLSAIDPDLVAALKGVCDEIGTRATDRLASAHDASHYMLTPRAVATAGDADEVAGLMAVSRDFGVPIAFRSGGTSLSGQAGTDGLLVNTRRNFRRVDVLDGGDRVRVQPGATVRAVNARLARYGRKLGPDPASEVACTIGGVVANNSSGMSCGTEANAYQTLESAVLVLPSGTIVDTGAPLAAETLRTREPALYAGLELLRDRIRKNEDSVATIRRLYAIKNTMGYGLNSFLDYTEPLDILEHLIIGSEGTLAFVAEATFRTVALKPQRATGLLVFQSLADATAALPALVEVGFATIELMDAASLRVAQRDRTASAIPTDFVVLDHAALLVELDDEIEETLEARVQAASGVFRALPLVFGGSLTTDADLRDELWRIRKGLFAAVAGERPSGSTSILEDIAVPLGLLHETCAQLITLLDRHGYHGSVVFGHAKDGNIHFLINEQLDDRVQLERYRRFTEDLVEIVLSRGGTLKAEHGTGRMMAPYVEMQYGTELHEVMWEIKRLFDPGMLLNPGVILTDDPHAHSKNLKVAPSIEPEVDRCVECGYCEPVCPSQDLTISPRERIVLRRELQLARDRGDATLAQTLEREYEYDGIQTCAVDGMCQTACPVLINTGELVRRLRAQSHSTAARASAKVAAQQWDLLSAAGGMALTVADAIPSTLPNLVTRAARALAGNDTVPLYTADLPTGGSRRTVLKEPDAVAVYFASCTSTMFGPVGAHGVAESFIGLCAHAGVRLRTPDDLPSLCCGTPWSSKGLPGGYEVMRDRVAASLLLATEGGRLPVVTDASSCTEGLETLLKSAGGHDIRVLDAVTFVDEQVLQLLPNGRRVPSLTLHPTCSSQRLRINPAFERVASAVADTVVVPDHWGCCAFAGDRGMLHPELTASATARQAEDIRDADSTAHASLNRTCEIGMTRATGREYRHILQVLYETLIGS